ncbi:hypothetical protein I552_1015 [Mycobacterium xenopi 3993]|nr:hypothetical protein I552_1015 [Mycobacterium xenopi 3993]
MTTQLRQAIACAAAVLAEAGIGSARYDAEELAAHLAGLSAAGCHCSTRPMSSSSTSTATWSVRVPDGCRFSISPGQWHSAR